MTFSHIKSRKLLLWRAMSVFASRSAMLATWMLYSTILQLKCLAGKEIKQSSVSKVCLAHNFFTQSLKRSDGNSPAFLAIGTFWSFFSSNCLLTVLFLESSWPSGATFWAFEDHYYGIPQCILQLTNYVQLNKSFPRSSRILDHSHCSPLVSLYRVQNFLSVVLKTRHSTWAEIS